MKYTNQHDLIEPWALRAWHIDYKVFTGLMSRKERLNARKRMLKIRREAALERKLEAAQRKIEALEHEWNQAHDVAMCKCGINPAADPHPCPFQADVNNDSDYLCTCCDSCTDECAMDI